MPPQTSPQSSGIRLAEFIHENTPRIVNEWENFARTIILADGDQTPLALSDHIQQILIFIVKDINSPQTRVEQVQKSQGRKEKDATPTAAEIHAALRLAGGYDIDQMVSEYRSLRASVVKLWSEMKPEMDKQDVLDLTRFNESIDQELAESVSHYTKKVIYSKDLFVGILSHELRNPLNVISMSAQLILSMGPTSERQDMLTQQIFENTSYISHIVNQLLDVTRARFGSGFPVIRAPMDMEFVSRQLVDDMRATHPTRTFTLIVSGDLKGEWDKTRIVQVFTNLIRNAIQYSFIDSPIKITVKGMPEDVRLTVHNMGALIPPEKITNLFDSLTRAVIDEGSHPEAVNLGLGLYITKEIIVSHSGTIEVTSSEEAGTTFIVRFPRAA